MSVRGYNDNDYLLTKQQTTTTTTFTFTFNINFRLTP